MVKRLLSEPGGGEKTQETEYEAYGLKKENEAWKIDAVLISSTGTRKGLDETFLNWKDNGRYSGSVFLDGSKSDYEALRKRMNTKESNPNLP